MREQSRKGCDSIPAEGYPRPSRQPFVPRSFSGPALRYSVAYSPGGRISPNLSESARAASSFSDLTRSHNSSR